MPAAARPAPLAAPLPELFSPKGHAVRPLFAIFIRNKPKLAFAPQRKNVHFPQLAAIANMRLMAPRSSCPA
ncbi:hypothetical protein CJ263_05575 [Maribacter cobaltidurans]|uniref:Uncharacterized protein n=1 Tax=Maribacter cobaltidurans TaxID=1178778 RepID=A0A223V4F9_9FLAO|nr:hypothetical protein CJ263_05575 [Maribacter cobaltidurans]